jgi:hypothetical protein
MPIFIVLQYLQCPAENLVEFSIILDVFVKKKIGHHTSTFTKCGVDSGIHEYW